MVAVLKLVEEPKILHWHAELSETEMVWCDLLPDERFSADLRNLSQYVYDYRSNLKNHVDHCLNKPNVYLLCRREKVRFNLRKKSRYNFFTKKTTFHLLVGKTQQKVSVAVKLADHFFENTPNPRILLESKFITLIAGDSEDLTLSIHDFLFSVGAELSLQCEVVATGCSPSPYWQNSATMLGAFTNDVRRYLHDDADLMVYLGGYLFEEKVLRRDGSFNSEFVHSDNWQESPMLLMMARALALYFLGGNNGAASMAVKSAQTNLHRFMTRNQLHQISITHHYEYDNEYLRLGAGAVESAPSHDVHVALEDGALMINGEPVYPN